MMQFQIITANKINRITKKFLANHEGWDNAANGDPEVIALTYLIDANGDVDQALANIEADCPNFQCNLLTALARLYNLETQARGAEFSITDVL